VLEGKRGDARNRLRVGAPDVRGIDIHLGRVAVRVVIVDWLHPDDYPVEVLADWKAQHERNARIDGSVLSPLTEDRLLDLIEKAVASADHQSERQLVFALLSFLDGRRVLFDPWTLEEPEHVAASILEIRSQIDGDLARLKSDAKAVDSLRAIRAACLQYLTRVPHPEDAPRHWPDVSMTCGRA
jgi:hypothetical protein